MRLFAIALLPFFASAFAPPSRHGIGLRVQSPLFMANEVEELASDIVQKAEDVLEKVDNKVVDRGIRLLNHVPILYTLKEFGQAVSSSRFGIDAAPAAFAGSVSSPALLHV